MNWLDYVVPSLIAILGVLFVLLLISILLKSYLTYKSHAEAEEVNKRMEAWAAMHYPDFIFDECPHDPDAPNFEELYGEWFEDQQDIISEFHSWEEENGKYDINKEN